ncbi:S53 family peptidase [Lentilactobacillus diolivorans]|uniref:Protease n=2 Tax=Lentilactobacillus diolivorans TaxID=179838 RepID=A0A0R1SCY3_9LACO|nr:S53 family peptidase [Lentilactobacillus diolivorans]KRL64133.1 protease [Lentilactobacillus diolivorans DSM 14421]GEP25301.1 aspartyl protease [Lentilactobacillus diolivorans]
MNKMKRFWLSILAISTVITGIIMNNVQVNAKAKQLNNTQVNEILTKSKLQRPSKIKSDQETTFDVFLKPKHEHQYFQESLDVNTPGNGQFKHYLTPTEIGNKFGQSNSVISDWTSFLKKHGLKTTISKNKRVIFVSGKAGTIGKLFKTNLNSAKYHHNPLQFGKVRPKFPKSLSNSLLAIVGMTDHSHNNVFPNTDQLTKTSSLVHKMGGYTNRFTKTYHLNSLLERGFNGKGNTVGIVSFEEIHRSNVFHFWKHEHAGLSPDRFTVKNVQGSFFNPKMVSNDSMEATMDVEYAGSVAPQANIRMYREKSAVPSLLNTVSLFNTAYDENKVSSLSMSWGLQSSKTNALMEKYGMLPKAYLKILSLTFAQGDLQGISTFVGSGDTGAGNYYVKRIKKNYATLGYSQHSNDIVTTNPWLTSCGGTTLPYSYKGSTLGYSEFGNISNKTERAWGSSLMKPLQSKPELVKKNPMIRLRLTVGDGGGFSESYATPSYQQSVPGVNTFNARKLLTKYNYPIFNAPLISGTGQGRNFPDISANADVLTPYIVYQKEKRRSPWVLRAGTSIVGPQMAGAIADLNSGRNTRMGFLNAQIYQLATTQDSPFNPLNSTVDNNNMYYTGQPGTVYNQASGLGTVNFEKLFEEYK